jgi:cytochrome c-type biogenesis protein CcmE
MTTGKKLLIGGMVMAAATAYMAYRGATATWQYYLTADECLADQAGVAGRPLRVSGRVAPGTLVIEAGRTRVSFTLAGETSSLPVVCAGPLPGNLAEGMAVLVEGRLDGNGVLRGDKLLTRCAGKYQSRPPTSIAETPGRATEANR